MSTVYLGIGSNLGVREENIARALNMLARQHCAILSVSPLYETEPWGLAEQPRFLNAACLIETDLLPEALLDTLKAIETELGRVSTVRNGPRTIDLDILLYDGLCLATERLTIPHAGMLQRATVLVPLNDIAPEARHPVTGLTISAHLHRLYPLRGIAPYPPGFGTISS